jgi:hypothetical protein
MNETKIWIRLWILDYLVIVRSDENSFIINYSSYYTTLII